MRKYKKRLLSLVLAIVLCLGLLPGTALAEDVDLSGMTDKFAQDTEEAVTWPIYQDMQNWNLLTNDEGRSTFRTADGTMSSIQSSTMMCSCTAP